MCDRLIDALQRSMLSEFELQKKAQDESFVAELSVKKRHLNGGWERRFESASEAWAEEKSLLMSRLEVAQAAQKRLENRVEQLEAIIQNWACEEDDNWWAADTEEYEVEALGGSRSGNRMFDPASSGAIHHELDRDDGYSSVGTDAAGDITTVAATVASKAAMNASLMSKAYEKLVVPTFPSSGEMTN